MMSNNLPIMNFIGMPNLPEEPKRRGNNTLGRFFTNMELGQIKTRMTLQADIMQECVRLENLKGELVMNYMTANQKAKTILAEQEARETIARSKAEEAMLSAMDRRLEYLLKKKDADEVLGENKDR